MSQVPPRRYWERAIQRLARGVNLALWLDRFAPVAFGVCTIAAVIVYAARRQRVPMDFFWIALGVVAVTSAGVVAILIRRQFFAAEDARLFLESSLKLDSRLSAAAAGLVEWPEVRDRLPRVLRWRAAPVLGWLSGAAALLLMSVSLPVPAAMDRTPRPAASPPALAETEAMLSELQKTEIADPRAVEELATEARELATRPVEQQYTHSGLEAADTLHDETLAAIDMLAQQFESAASAFRSAENADSANGEGLPKTASDQLSAALQGLKEGKLPSNPALLGAMAKAAARAHTLTPREAAELAQRLSEASGKGRGIAGARKGRAAVAKGDPNQRFQANSAGAGGTGGGGSSAPLAFSETATPPNEGKLAALSSDDLSRSSLGDALGLASDKHEVDPAKAVGPQSAGVVEVGARGGEAAWVDHLAPAERTALKDFFK